MIKKITTNRQNKTVDMVLQRAANNDTSYIDAVHERNGESSERQSKIENQAGLNSNEAFDFRLHRKNTFKKRWDSVNGAIGANLVVNRRSLNVEAVKRQDE